MSKTVISIRLSDEDIQALDHFAKTIPLSRSRVIERLVSDFLAQDFNQQGGALREKFMARKGKAHG